ncbi:MAG: RpiB/LacA/LacB family sugar-phosphate isomerase [bacterium]|nr:RpiB/LacA/LacB family sugar-phosphate isomerase [bacterium]
MKKETIYIASDHGGFLLKETLKRYLESLGFVVLDVGATSLNDTDDYPQYAFALAHEVVSKQKSRGIVLCGSGQGVCITANRMKGIRAVQAWNVASAKMSRNDDDANVLCLGARLISTRQAKEIVNVWLETPFAKETRFKRRIKKIDKGKAV